ncbi:hypothetical protein SLA_4686 [Streptomyces laurentii]|uniref:Uncharacterized protein n=1 Tax=Streptomyces laurentii TaxID=39478 RepID=A0A160P4Q4_STRLU|nr:hypothetical protein SLA_4686 [Streptomyces laurentii]
MPAPDPSTPDPSSSGPPALGSPSPGSPPLGSPPPGPLAAKPPPVRPPGDLRRADPAASEATRLLCAGAYLDEAFRDAVIDELYVHEERVVAPSLGIDAARVLAHALRARRIELGGSAAILGLWIVAYALTGGLVLILIVPVLLLALARKIHGKDLPAPLLRTVPAFLLRLYALLLYVLAVVTYVDLLFSDESDTIGFFATVLRALLVPLAALQELIPGIALVPTVGALWGIGTLQALVAFAVLPLVAGVAAVQRGWFARALTGELSRARFADPRGDPAEQALGLRFRRLREQVRMEQTSRLVMYRSENPFCGAGKPYETWSLSVELRPREDLDGPPEPLDNSAILRHIVPLLEALREPPSQHDRVVRDRLRELELDEVVFLPIDGLPSRDEAPYTDEDFERHRAGAIEEGGETRRHFLRIRVGGWGEEIVTTVFVRVHTQGGMLMLEVAPHVLRPVASLYRNADRIAHRYRHNHQGGKAVWALGQTSHFTGQALVTLWRALKNLGALSTGGYGRALPEGPLRSVRELAAEPAASLFQEMDVSRYLKSIQDRVANGVTVALRQAGYETAEFEQKIVQVGEGGMFIEGTQGNVTVGDHNKVSSKSVTITKTKKGSGGKRG